MSETTDGTLLGGKVRYRQFASGHRSGFEPVLLAACVKAKPGDTVLEAGTGAGAALLCLGRRLPGISGSGIEIDPALVALANENFKLNGLDAFCCLQGDARQLPSTVSYDHVFANPPWFDPAGTKSPDPARARAHHARHGELAAWVSSLVNCVKPKGTVTLILPAALTTKAVSLLASEGCGAITIFPLWPRAGQPAGQVIISTKRHSRASDTLLPGLILHDSSGITPAANEILREGAAISLVADRKTPHTSDHFHPARG